MHEIINPEQIWVVDAFTNRAFLGNAAAVCLLDNFPDTEVMQSTAMAMQLSETAFVVPRGMGAFDIRWFTPQTEVNLCGHATLAATHVLVQSGKISRGDAITFSSMSGTLSANVLADGSIAMDFPSLPSEPATPPAALEALGVPMLACELSRDNYLIEVEDYATLIACMPNFKKLRTLDAQGVIVTTSRHIPIMDGKVFDFASRYFCPVLGIDEDPVTGSAHCTLAPYWATRLGKKEFLAYQASRGRGVLRVQFAGARTIIAGHCVTTLRATPPVKVAASRRQAKKLGEKAV